MMNRIVLVEDHRLFRLAIAGIINQETDLTIANEYADPDEALQNLENDQADLYMVDISLEDKDGLNLARRIKNKSNHPKIIILSMHKEEFFLIKSIENDVDGYIHKDVYPDELVLGIRKVLKGDKHYSTEVSHILINNVYSKVNEFGKTPTLSSREKEIIKHITEGLSSKEISDRLSLSPRTIETHRGRILNKLGLKNTAELVRLAIEQKLV